MHPWTVDAHGTSIPLRAASREKRRSPIVLFDRSVPHISHGLQDRRFLACGAFSALEDNVEVIVEVWCCVRAGYSEYAGISVSLFARVCSGGFVFEESVSFHAR